MRRQLALLISLFLVGTEAATVGAEDAVKPDPKLLVGIWDGTRTRIQAGKCSFNGRDRNEDQVRVVVRLTDEGKVTAGYTLLPAVVDIDDNAAIRVHKKKLVFEIPGTAVCGSTPRKYTVRHEINAAPAVDGARTLRFVGKDELCPQSGCVFQLVYDLTFKGDPK